MKSYRLFGRIAGVFASLLVAVSAIYAADTNLPSAEARRSRLPLAEFLGFAKGLEINPKIVTSADGLGATFGLDYKYDREMARTAFRRGGETDLGLSLRSHGLVVADEKRAPNHVFTHGLRFSIIDILPLRRVEHDMPWPKAAKLKRHITKNYYFPWTQSLMNPNADPQEAENLFEAASKELKDYGELEADAASQRWFFTDRERERVEFGDALTKVAGRPLFLAVDLDGQLEHDQSLTNVQWVASAQVRGKLLMPFLDWPFELLRGGPAKNWLNRNGGPHFWAGIGVVDGSHNDARRAVSSDHQVFPRVHCGVFYRTELFSISEAKSVALEAQWRYYHEIDAPSAVRARKLARTSYVKVTALFPGNYFVEYTEGRLPTDVERGSTVSAGWRHNF